MPVELMKPTPPIIYASQPLRVGFILATGKKKDRSVNEYLLKNWHRIGKQSRIKPSPPIHPGTSLATAEHYVRELSRDHSHIVGIGSFMLGPFVNAIKPGRDWPRLAIIDGETDHGYIKGINFREDIAARIAGYLAARIASIREQNVAFLGGCLTPAVQRWEHGFADGVKIFNNEVQCEKNVICHVDYVGETHTAFWAGATAYRLAEYYIERQGVAVIMQVCGAAARHVVDKARSKGNRENNDWVGIICTDYDGWRTDDPVLFSLTRRLDQAINIWIDGKFSNQKFSIQPNMQTTSSKSKDNIVAVDSTMIDAVSGPAWKAFVQNMPNFESFRNTWKEAQNKVDEKMKG